MSTDLEQIQAIKTQSLAMLEELSSVPKPSYTLDGYTISWAEYQQRLLETIDWCDRKINAYSPFEFKTQATT